MVHLVFNGVSDDTNQWDDPRDTPNAKRIRGNCLDGPQSGPFQIGPVHSSLLLDHPECLFETFGPLAAPP